MKYIDADKLIVEIKRLNSLVPYENKDRHDDGLHDAYKVVENVIDSLQQEQPVDLEKAAVEYQLKTRGRLNVMGGDAVLSKEEYMKFNSNKDFIAGARWMAEQMKGGSK